MSEPEWEKIAPDTVLRFRTACFIACLGWECHCDVDTVNSLMQDTLGDCPLSAYQLWTLDLYREGATSYGEGRAVLAHLLHRISSTAQAERIRQALLQQLPEKCRPAAECHPLMLGWRPIRLPEEDTTLRRFLHDLGLGSDVEARDYLPPVEREDAFNSFLEISGFRDAFQRYWQQPPKFRDNLRTRVLVIIAAILASTVELLSEDQCQLLTRRLEAECHVTPQTAIDILEIACGLYVEQLPVAELGERLIIDATEADRNNIGALLRIIADNPAESEGKRVRATMLNRQLEPFLQNTASPSP